MLKRRPPWKQLQYSRMSQKRLRIAAWTAFAAGLIILAVEITGFFLQLNSTTSDHSSGDIAFHVQLFHNFSHGRFFESTLCREYWPNARLPAYVNTNVNHSNFTPFMFTPLYRLLPGINGFYALTIGINLIAVGLFGWIFIWRYGQGKELLTKRLIFLAAVCASHFFRIASYQGHMLLFGTPFALAAHWGATRRSQAWFWPAFMALCLVSEDAAMYGVTYAAYLFFFERDFRRQAIAALLVAGMIFGADVLVIMPAARAGLFSDHASFFSWALATRRHAGAFLMWGWVDLWPALVFLLALAAAALAVDFNARFSRAKAAGLIFLAPLSFWVISALTYGEHHLMPIFWGMFIALAAMLTAEPSPRLKQTAFRTLLIGYALAFLFAEARSPERWSFFQAALNIRRWAVPAKNLEFINAVRALPSDATVVYWTQPSLEGFFADRRGLWRYPAFKETSDYVVLQREAAGKDFETAINELSATHAMEQSLPDGAILKALPATR
jgi:hypothetical protein